MRPASKIIARFSLSIVVCSLLASIAAAQSSAVAQTSAARSVRPGAPLTQRELALQMLNRFTFGPRPGDLDNVTKMGPEAWFAQQLNPASIPDPVLDRRMADYPSLYLPPSQLLVQFPSNQVIRKIADGQRPYPPDPLLAAAYEVLVAKYNRRQQKDQAQATASAAAVPPAAPAPSSAAPVMPSAPAMAAAPAMASTAALPAAPPSDDDPVTRRQQQQAAQVLADQVLAFPRDQRMQAIVRLPLDQRITLTKFVPDPQRSLLLNDFTPSQKELFYLMAGGPDGTRVIDSEFQQAKVLRAVLSERQLLEVMTDFWYNHFNVDIRKEATQWYAPTYERDAIRAHALGKFSDLLLATAQSPAMLFYLDNWSSIGPDSIAAGRGKKQRGLNENYGREVMELHTVGVDAGYSQADVTNLAKILTGWTIDQPQQGGGFIFDPRKHEPGTIPWFGQKMRASDNSPEAAYDEGRRALLWLAAQPQTAHYISYEIAQRFVADDPPPALVDHMAQTYLATGGDIAEILRTMVRSPEFLSHRYYRVKVKTPLEFVASVFRATDTNPSNPNAMVATIARMGEPLYQMQPPTGYSTTADHWMNSGALVDRLNFSLQFAQGKLGGIRFDAPRLLAQGLLAEPAASLQRSSGHAQPVSISSSGRPSGEDLALSLLERMLTDGQISPRTDQVIHHELEAQPDATAQPALEADPNQTLDTMTALILGSPEFQMH